MEQRVNIDFTVPIIMTLTFVLLKCANVIDWEWVWIFSPMYVFVALVLLVLFVVFVLKRPRKSIW